jgi:hypothetical protein
VVLSILLIFGFAVRAETKFKNAGRKPAVRTPTRSLFSLVSLTDGLANLGHWQECLCY